MTPLVQLCISEVLKFTAMDIRAERQSARMSKITNDGLTRSGTGCFIAVHMVSGRYTYPIHTGDGRYTYYAGVWACMRMVASRR